MPQPTQAHRQIAVSTPLGPDVLLLRSFSGSEEMSRLFRFQLEMFSEEDWIDPASIVGKRISFRVVRGDNDKDRHFNGFVCRFRAGDRDYGFRRYFAEVVPWLWFLTQTSDCRIFQDMMVSDIITKIFDDHGFSDYELRLEGSYSTWEYCVQYRESDFNFVSRLMEQEGIFYYFRHEQDKHKLILGDSPQAYFDCDESKVDYVFSEKSQRRDGVTTWEHQFEFISGKWAQTDYNFIDHPAKSERTPAKHLLRNANTVVRIPGVEKYELYDYPGEFETPGESSSYTKLRMEEEETPHDVANGSSTCKTFTVGGKFTFENHDCETEKGKTFVITSLQHSAVEPATYEGGEGVVFDYSNSFTCIPSRVVFRPERSTPKPVIQGSQTAVVSGPDGEEIFVDKYGRIKVQFFWDREGTRNDKTSCWIRTSQVAAGKNWGAMFIPRIGQEVIVSYLEGDPDRPLVTGVLYNSDQMPPYTLPDEKTKSYIKTNSSKGGDGYNELRFEDKAGSEQIFMHAQRNIDVRVLNDSMERIFGNRHQIIGYEKDGAKGGDQRERVYQDKHLNIKRHQSEHIEGNYELMVGNGDADPCGELHMVVEKKAAIKVGSDGVHWTIEGDRNEKIGGNQSLNVDSNENRKIGQNFALEAGQAIHIKAGMTVVIEAGTQLSLKVGGNFIDINPTGVYITGAMVMINSGGAAGSGAACQPQDPAAPNQAAPTEPTLADNHQTGSKSTPY
jgi:type VI secretion system secreted protein VgrG